MARRIAILLCIISLLALFIFPKRRLNDFCAEIEALANETVEAVHGGDWELCNKNLEQISRLYENDKVFLHMLLSHNCVEVLETSIRGSIQLIRVEDKPQALLELETIITHIRYLREVEQLKLLTLL